MSCKDGCWVGDNRCGSVLREDRRLRATEKRFLRNSITRRGARCEASELRSLLIRLAELESLARLASPRHVLPECSLARLMLISACESTVGVTVRPATFKG
jgi:hypothetical protein